MARDLVECLDRELKEAVERMLNQPQRMSLDDIPAARSASKIMMEAIKAQLPVVKGVIVEDKTIPGPEGTTDLPLRIYRPAKSARSLPALLWIHGGGYILGNVDQDDFVVKQLTMGGQCITASVEYRLAPQCQFPGPLEDCYAALKWLAASGEELGADPSRIALGGASAGGGLASGLALLARDRGEIKPTFQLLVYPMINDCNIAPASDILPETILWTRGNNLIGWRSYLGCEPGGEGISCYAAASRAVDLGGLPPAYLAVGDLDLFALEDVEYAGRLIAAGVPTELHVYPGACHAFDMVAPDATVSRRFTADLQRALKQALHG